MRFSLIILIALLGGARAFAQEESGEDSTTKDAKEGDEIPDEVYDRSGAFGLYLEARGTYLTGVEGVGYEYGAGGAAGFSYFLRKNLSLTLRYGMNRHDAVKKTIDWRLDTTRLEIAARYYNDAIELGPIFVEVAPGYNRTKLEIQNVPIPSTEAASPSFGLGVGLEGDLSKLVRAGFVARYTLTKSKDLDARYKNKNRINGPSVDVGLSLTALVP